MISDVQEIRQFFASIKREQREIEHLKLMIQEGDAMLLPQAIRYDKDKVQTTPSDKMSEIVAKVADMQKELGKSIYQLRKRQLQAENLIRKLDNANERELMRWYYLCYDDGKPYTFVMVAEKMGYSDRHVKRVHGSAILHLAEKRLAV